MLFTSKVVSYGCKEERVKDIKSFENILLKLNEGIFFFKILLQNAIDTKNWFETTKVKLDERYFNLIHILPVNKSNLKKNVCLLVRNIVIWQFWELFWDWFKACKTSIWNQCQKFYDCTNINSLVLLVLQASDITRSNILSYSELNR